MTDPLGMKGAKDLIINLSVYCLLGGMALCVILGFWKKNAKTEDDKEADQE